MNPDFSFYSALILSPVLVFFFCLFFFIGISFFLIRITELGFFLWLRDQYFSFELLNKLAFFSLAFFFKKETFFFTTFVFVSLFDFKGFQGGGQRF